MPRAATSVATNTLGCHLQLDWYSALALVHITVQGGGFVIVVFEAIR